MAWTLKANTLATPGSGGGTTSAIDTTGADLLIVGVSAYADNTATNPTDSKGNSWTALTRSPVNDPSCRFFYALPGTVGTGHTFTWSSAGSYPVIMVLAFGGVGASPFDKENGARGVTVSSLATGSVTPVEDGELLVSIWAGLETGTNPSCDNGFSLVDSVAFGNGNNCPGASAYLVQATAAAINPTWSWTTASTAAAALATFKVAAAVANVPDRGTSRGLARGIARGLANARTMVRDASGLLVPKDRRLVIPVGLDFQGA